MENLFTVSTSQLFLYLAALPLFIMALILFQKHVVKHRRSFDFNTSHYLVGLALSLSTSVALMNWEISDEPVLFQVEDGLEEPIVNIPRTTQEQIRKAVPPPPKPKKLIKKLDLTKLKLVKEEPVLENDLKLIDIEEVPDPPALTAAKAAPPPTPKPIIVEDEPAFVSIAEQMPRFPGCEELHADKAAREDCSKKALLNYIYGELKYPPYARENGIEGMVVLQFVVSKEGRIEDLKIARDIGGGCGAAAAKVVSSMNDMEEPWVAGKQRGRPVRVRYTLPVKFKIKR